MLYYVSDSDQHDIRPEQLCAHLLSEPVQPPTQRVTLGLELIVKHKVTGGKPANCFIATVQLVKQQDKLQVVFLARRIKYIIYFYFLVSAKSF